MSKVRPVACEARQVERGFRANFATPFFNLVLAATFRRELRMNFVKSVE